MIWTSPDTMAILFLVWIVYSVASLRFQNYLLLIISLIFYLSWGWLSLVTFLGFSLFTYLVSLLKNAKLRAIWAVSGLIGGLLLFKILHLQTEEPQSQLTASFIFIPIGISFYTLRLLSYIFDINGKTVTATRSFFEFLLFSSYFPLTLMGPIERYPHLAPQFLKRRRPQIVVLYEGLFLIALGFFKKWVVADRIIPVSNAYLTFGNQLNLFEVTIYLSLLTIQLFADFTAYIDIVRGVSKMFGIELTDNFNQPYFARNMGDFWNRWHRSLGSWARDYLYWPVLLKIRNIELATLIVFIFIGGWHGLKWNYLALFLFWSFLYILYLRTRNYRMNLYFLPGLLTLYFIAMSGVFLAPKRIEDLGGFLKAFTRLSLDFRSLGIENIRPLEYLIIALGFILIVLVETTHRKILTLTSSKVRNIFFGCGFLILLVLGILFGTSESKYFLYMRY